MIGASGAGRSLFLGFKKMPKNGKKWQKLGLEACTRCLNVCER